MNAQCLCLLLLLLSLCCEVYFCNLASPPLYVILSPGLVHPGGYYRLVANILRSPIRTQYGHHNQPVTVIATLLRGNNKLASEQKDILPGTKEILAIKVTMKTWFSHIAKV